jgi:hypothetical protein
MFCTYLLTYIDVGIIILFPIIMIPIKNFKKYVFNNIFAMKSPKRGMIKRSNFRRSKLPFSGDQNYCRIDQEIKKALGVRLGYVKLEKNPEI